MLTVIIIIVVIFTFPMLFFVYIPLGVICLGVWMCSSVPTKPIQSSPQSQCEQAGWVWQSMVDANGNHCVNHK